MLSQYLFRFMAYCSVFVCLLTPCNVSAQNPPTITKIDPSYASVGQEVTITGSNFGNDKSKITITSNKGDSYIDVPNDKNIVKWSEQEINIKLPNNTTQDNIYGKLIVTVNSKSAEKEFLFLPDPHPTITKIDPSYASVGQEVTITGSNFGNEKSKITITDKNGAAQIDVTDDTNIVKWSGNEIKIKLPNTTQDYINGKLKVTVNSVSSAEKDFNFSSRPLPTINSIVPKSYFKGDNVVINGENFGDQSAKPYIVLQYSDGGTKKEVKVSKFVNWSKDKIEFKVPEDFPSSDTFAKIININEFDLTSQSTAPTEFLIQNLNEYLEMAIVLKNSNNADESFILEYLAKEQQNRIDEDPTLYNRSKVFYGKKLNDIDLKALSENKFSQDFIGKLAGIPQRVTLGITAVWLCRTSELVSAPILRIFLSPKSYFEPRPPLSSKQYLNAIRKRTDFNFGYTIIKSDNGATSTNYVLAGLSFELNRSALLNFGGAWAENDVAHKKRQFYIGLTVDQNFLKEMGIIAK